ncbi:6-phosphogluconolactonase [Oceanispirochaeta sp. M2]|nr:6-phosphogluconolactonase [Oceanispirochaeta sp. M2]
MTICINENKETNGKEAALKGGLLIQKTLNEKGSARIILATGASQFEMISELIKADIDWSKVEVFHLDEYIGIPESHKASFRKYLKERFEAKVSNLKAFHYIKGDAENLDEELSRINGLISRDIIDVAFVGIGENAHLAFNDPPADFET